MSPMPGCRWSPERPRPCTGLPGGLAAILAYGYNARVITSPPCSRPKRCSDATLDVLRRAREDIRGKAVTLDVV